MTAATDTLTSRLKPEEKQHRLGDLLVSMGKLSARDLERAVSAQAEAGGLLPAVLINLGLVSELDVAEAQARLLGLPFVAAEEFPSLTPEVKGLQPDFLRTNHVYPLQLDESGLTVAMAAPDDAFILKALELATGLTIYPCAAVASDIERALASGDEAVDAEEEPGFEADAGDFVEHLKDLASEAPVIRLVNQVIGRVIDLRASDIHLEPFDDGLHVRYRVDGVIYVAEVVSSQLSAAVNSRVKLMAHLDIAERRLPQDGRIKTRVKGRELDLRVSTVPTVHGESVVMRVLDRSSVRYSLEAMGFAPDNLEHFNQLLARPHGILLITGPTGSGKTTTLYTALSKLDSTAHKIITVEEPVEYQLEGINQIQVHPQIGLTFASALRSILRQDPDIIMIGEMRDGETAQIAVQSALTGHLVLSTLHTNTAAGAIVRLQDMGIEPYLITSSVNGVISQRLVRRLCEHCKSAYAPDPSLVVSSGLQRIGLNPAQLFRAVGCEHCRRTGYDGRCGIHELLVLDDSMRRGILDGLDASALHAKATASGMHTLYEDGLRKVADGVTSLDELLRVTQDHADV
ncbi:type II secretion system ATPase GspE [Rhodoferax sp.]|uniref:type II secretion system ATPase GspE n=1 Tax=Rhodoferax sp. TaxID=50421 RepID=UPI00262D6D72|nr:type II secretion system ATPase GspE [Rhodoferax sp.]MDD2919861.1 type II secretion system ATPase GspE [Rhodoferax sp.]